MSLPTSSHPRARGAEQSLAAPTRPLYRIKAHIPEIDGLRGVAIALIVVYHVWLNKVSGGVDVFFLLSGFLVTMSLMRSTDSRGRVKFARFYARVARRIFPPALVVLVGIVGAAVLWLPQSRWRETVGDVVASALYVINWRLAENAVDYLASRFAASPVQHYWSLAVQAQFYLVWPLLIAVVAFLATRLALRPRRVLAVMLGATFAASLGYSIHRTGADQAYAYFDTFARIWEFAIGGLLALALPYLQVRRLTALVIGWIGFSALLVCGMVFQAGREFPGWAALWPTLAAAMMVVAAGNDHRLGADRLLRNVALRRLGDLSYALYLTHWPVLIFYYAITGRTTATLRGGVLVILVSLIVAAATKWLAEDRLRASGIGQQTTRGGFALASACLVAVLLTTAGWTGLIQQERREAAAATEAAEATAEDNRASGTPDLGPYPGAAHLVYGGELPDVSYRPGPLDVRDDRAGVLYPGCHQNPRDSKPTVCEIGDQDASRSIAVVGGSRSQHWLPALEVLADQHRWKILAITKSGCLFTGAQQYESCNEWNEMLLDELARLRPDAVFTTSTRAAGGQERTPNGYVERWKFLDSLGIRILAIRDIPRPLVDVPDCVETRGPDAAACGVRADTYSLDQRPAVEQRPDVPDNVSFLDLTELLCADGFCPAIIGNVLVYHDNSHLTATYARTLAPFLGNAIAEATGW